MITKAWHHYDIVLRHDRGEVRFFVPCTRMTLAVRRLLTLERAPFRAIVSIRRGRRIA